MNAPMGNTSPYFCTAEALVGCDDICNDGCPFHFQQHHHNGYAVEFRRDYGCLFFRMFFLEPGTEGAMDQTFGSTCHGAGRLLSRKKAKQAAQGRSIKEELENDGIFVMSSSRATMAEEMPEAYKNVSDVVEAVVGAGISKKVAKLKPLGGIKG